MKKTLLISFILLSFAVSAKNEKSVYTFVFSSSLTFWADCTPMKYLENKKLHNLIDCIESKGTKVDVRENIVVTENVIKALNSVPMLDRTFMAKGLVHHQGKNHLDKVPRSYQGLYILKQL